MRTLTVEDILRLSPMFNSGYLTPKRRDKLMQSARELEAISRLYNDVWWKQHIEYEENGRTEKQIYYLRQEEWAYRQIKILRKELRMDRLWEK